MRHNYKLFIFDWDGTLMDSVPRIVSSMQQAAHELQLPKVSDEAVKQIIGLSLDTAIQQLWGALKATEIQAIQQCYGRHFLQQSQVPMPFFAGALALLEWLKAQPTKPYLAVATGKKRAGLERILQAHEMQTYFDVTVCADETRSKPHPHMLQHVLKTLNVAPQQALMLGDTDYDINMAQAAGMDSLAVTYGAHAKKRLVAAQPTVLCDSIAQIKHWLTT